LRQKPPQRVIHQFQSFVLGGVQQFQILLHRGGFGRLLE
jgi:hypothetical protein